MTSPMREGRDPSWLEAYDRLSEDARMRVIRAVSSGQVVVDPQEAVVAAVLARRMQRAIRRQAMLLLPVQVVLAMVWLTLALRGRLPSLAALFWTGALIVLVVFVPVVLRRRYLQVRRAAEANQWSTTPRTGAGQ
jgi:hypothetical protein